MKKFASLLLALAMVLTSVSALAKVVPSKTTSDLCAVTSLTEGVVAGVVDPDFKAMEEVARLSDAFMSGIDLEDCFNTAVAADIAGASDLLDVIAVAFSGDTEGETVEILVYGSVAYADVVCVLGIYDSALNLYNYVTLPTVCNSDGTATVTMDVELFHACVEAESVVLAMVQL